MQYYQKPPPEFQKQVFGDIYSCNNPCYNRCTLFKEGEVGLAVIQQRYNSVTKHTWWDRIDPWLANDIYTNPEFPKLFRRFSGHKDEKDCYPTLCVRPVMRKLGMPPLPKEIWETRF